MTAWELRAEVLRRAAQEGPIYAGSGYGPLFEEMMLARQDGLLREVGVVGVTYLEITEAGLDEYKALRR